MGVVKVSRAQVLAYRFAAQGLHREASSAGDLAVLDIGVQEAMGQPAGYAFAARVADVANADPPVGPGHRLALAWTLRGAPHVHRRADLDALARALWPLSEADAAGRLNETGPSVKRAGIDALDQLAIAVKELRAAVPKPTGKGAVSTAVTKKLPKPMRRECRACKTSHISESAMRVASLPAGLELQPDTSPPVLQRRKGAKPAKGFDAGALTTLAHSYLRLLGPATVGDVAGYLEARRADVAAVWSDDGLAEVSVDGKSAWLPDDCVDALRAAPEPDLVRLLGPFDPFMQARDRALVVPDKSVYKTLWPVLGRPGVLLVEGEVAGVWRTKASGPKLTITVEPFGPQPKSVWTRVDAEAERIAHVRQAEVVKVVRKD
jgi:hypothetical protein